MTPPVLYAPPLLRRLMPLLVALLVAAPIAAVYIEAAREGASAMSDVLLRSREIVLLLRSTGLALLVAAAATVLGTAAALALERATERAKGPLLWTLLLPVLVPQHIMAIAWVDILGRNGYLAKFVHIALPGEPAAPSPYTLLGAAFILSATLYPVPLLATHAALRHFDARLLEPAWLAGHRARAVTGITLPLVSPAVWTAFILVFAMALSSFAVPSLLQVTTYPVEIHSSSVTFDYASAAAQSIPLLLLCIIAYLIWTRYVRPRHAWLGGRSRGIPPQHASAGATAALVLLTACTWLAPLAALFVRSLPLRTYASVWATAHSDIITGLVVAAGTATVFTAVTFLTAYALRGSRLRTSVRAIAVAAFVLPGPLLALGMIALWNRPGFPALVYDSLWILVLAAGARFFVLGDAPFSAGLSRLDARLEESAAVSGLSPWRTLVFIVRPLTLPYFLMVWTLLFIVTLGDVDTAVLLAPPGYSTFAVRLFSLMHYGPDSFVAALSLMVALGVAAVAGVSVVAARYILRRPHA